MAVTLLQDGQRPLEKVETTSGSLKPIPGEEKPGMLLLAEAWMMPDFR